MKLNISYPANGSQKIIEIDDERKLRPFMEKRMGAEVSIPISPEFKHTHIFYTSEILAVSHTYPHTHLQNQHDIYNCEERMG
jgi:hypothetical protein